MEGGAACFFVLGDAQKNSLFRVRFRTRNKLFFRAVYWQWKKRGVCLRILRFTQNSCGVVVMGRENILVN